MFRIRTLTLALAALAVCAVIASDADARSRGSVGSRGTRTYSAPPPTATAPGSARPIERSAVQPGTAAATRPSTTAPASGGFLNRPGILGGLAAGFIGAGLFGLLFGHGLMGGLGGLASVFGLLLQVALVFFIGRMIWSFWQRRSQPAYAGGNATGNNLSNSSSMGMFGSGRNSLLGNLFGGGGGPAQSQQQQQQQAPVDLKPEDFDAFERLLGETLTAYGAEDVNALRSKVTPEMLSYYSDEMAQNVSNGDINTIANVKLLQGDLSESWSEDEAEYATVAMRFSLDDKLVDRKDGKLIEQLPSEVKELWTFRRARGGQWLLSAVQQTE